MISWSCYHTHIDPQVSACILISDFILQLCSLQQFWIAPEDQQCIWFHLKCVLLVAFLPANKWGTSQNCQKQGQQIFCSGMYNFQFISLIPFREAIKRLIPGWNPASYLWTAPAILWSCGMPLIVPFLGGHKYSCHLTKLITTKNLK